MCRLLHRSSLPNWLTRLVRSFLAGALPLSFALTQSQLRLISTIGMGILVGTSLVVIIPEGIETLYKAGSVTHPHKHGGPVGKTLDVRWEMDRHASMSRNLPWQTDFEGNNKKTLEDSTQSVLPSKLLKGSRMASLLVRRAGTPKDESAHSDSSLREGTPTADDQHFQDRSPHTFVGISLLFGFLLMYLIDKIPQHASSISEVNHQTHISLENLRREGGIDGTSDLHSDSQHGRHLSTTTGLVIHAAADGIALGASSSTANTRLNMIIFIAIMIHKAPAAFGLTSILLKQGLSKRAARAHLVIFSLAAPAGALITWCLVNIAGRGRINKEEDTQWFTGILLLFSAGTFL